MFFVCSFNLCFIVLSTTRLFNVLVAYQLKHASSIDRIYVQGMNFIAGFLLLQMPEEVLEEILEWGLGEIS